MGRRAKRAFLLTPSFGRLRRTHPRPLPSREGSKRGLPLAAAPARPPPMRPALALALLAALAGCSVSEPPASPPVAQQPELMKWPALLERTRPEPDSTIAYGDDQMQKVDLWLPAGRGPHPTVLMVHGGCWQTEIADRRIMNWIADDLRKRGIAVWNIDYRGVDRTGGGYPGTFADAAAAADALQRPCRATQAGHLAAGRRRPFGGRPSRALAGGPALEGRPVSRPAHPARQPSHRRRSDCRSTPSSASAACPTSSWPRLRRAAAAAPR